MARQVWTNSRKWMGNLIPFLLCLPFGVGAVLLFRPNQGLTGWALFCVIAFPLVGWLSLNWLGLWDNEIMRRQVLRLYERTQPAPELARIWVGAARPSYRDALDPHEEVGFLVLHEVELEFFSETLKLKIPKDAIKLIGRGLNPHSLVGLGGWVVIHGEIEGQPIQLKVEPREKPTLLGNVQFRKRLIGTLEKWLKNEKSEPDSGSDLSGGG